MKNYTKHNLIYILFEILIGIEILVLGILFYGIKTKNHLIIIISSILLFLIFILLIFLIKIRPNKK